MSGLLVGDQNYARVHRKTLRRRFLVTKLLANAVTCFPGLSVVDADLPKYHENDEFFIDVIIFDFSSSCWWAAFVVPEVDDLEGQVLFPLQWIRRVSYLEEDIAPIVDQLNEPGDQAAAQSLMRDEVPGAVAFLSNPHPDWHAAVKAAEGHLAVLEWFASPQDQIGLLRVNGDLPRARGRALGRCATVPGAGQVLHSPTPLFPSGVEMCVIEWEKEQLWLRVIEMEEGVLLTSTVPVSWPSTELDVWELADGRYELRIHEETAWPASS